MIGALVKAVGPDAFGVDLCKELMNFGAKTPILFYSGSAYDKDSQQALESDAQGYLTKAPDSDELIAEVLCLVNASRANLTKSAYQ